MNSELLPLSEVVRVLRSELATAMEAGHDETIRFELGSVEFEVNVVVARETAGKLDTSFKIFGWSIGGNLEAKESDQRVQKLKITLKPTDSVGGKVSISSKK